MGNVGRPARHSATPDAHNIDSVYLVGYAYIDIDNLEPKGCLVDISASPLSPVMDESGAPPAAVRARRLARVMYGANVVGAGLPGLVIVAAPEFAADNFFGEPQDVVGLGILGSIWLSIGLVSILGLREPDRYLGVFAVQALYKTIWIATGALPLLRARPDVIPYAAGFTVVTVGFVGALVLAARARAEARR